MAGHCIHIAAGLLCHAFFAKEPNLVSDTSSCKALVMVPLGEEHYVRHLPHVQCCAGRADGVGEASTGRNGPNIMDSPPT